MPQQEKGKWPPYNVRAIVNNVALVFKNRDISKLNNTAYKFISLHMGFIAHYDLYGFRSTYEDLEEFARNLQTSEGYGSGDYDYNLQQADRQETDRQFNEWYGPAYNKSIAETIRGVVAVARKYYPGRGTASLFNEPATRYQVGTRVSRLGRGGTAPGLGRTR